MFFIVLGLGILSGMTLYRQQFGQPWSKPTWLFIQTFGLACIFIGSIIYIIFPGGL